MDFSSAITIRTFYLIAIFVDNVSGTLTAFAIAKALHASSVAIRTILDIGVNTRTIATLTNVLFF